MALTTNDFKDGVSWTGAGNTATIGPFTVLGGRYGMVVSSTGTASAVLYQEAPDNNFIAVGAAVTTAATFDLPPGTYEIITGAAATVCAGSLIRVPYRAV